MERIKLFVRQLFIHPRTSALGVVLCVVSVVALKEGRLEEGITGLLLGAGFLLTPDASKVEEIKEAIEEVKTKKKG